MPEVSARADPELAARDLEARRAWVARELELQDGVASRAQLTFGGHTPNDVRRAIRRRKLQAVHPRRGSPDVTRRLQHSRVPKTEPVPHPLGHGTGLSHSEDQLQPEVEPQPSQT